MMVSLTYFGLLLSSSPYNSKTLQEYKNLLRVGECNMIFMFCFLFFIFLFHFVFNQFLTILEHHESGRICPNLLNVSGASDMFRRHEYEMLHVS